MKIHVMSGWDVPTTSIAGSGSNLVRGPIPNTMFEIMATSSDEFITAQTTALGWLMAYTTVTNTNYGNNRNRIHGNVKTASPSIGPASNLFHGIRYSVASVSPDTQVLSYMNTYDAGGANALTVFSKTDLPGYALNKQYYLEHQLDFVNGVVNRWVDSKALAPLPMPTFMLTAVSAAPAGQELWLALGALLSSNVPSGTPCYWSWRDMYYIEWEAGEKPQPLGPVVIDKLPIANVAAPAWTTVNPATGTVLDALKKGYSNPSTAINTNYVLNDEPMSQAAITYDASAIPLNANIKAVNVKTRGVQWTTTPYGKVGVSLTAGGVETSDVDVTYGGAQIFVDKVFGSDKNPSGQAWTQPLLAGLTVKVKPKV